jgi:hypothetical protein
MTKLDILKTGSSNSTVSPSKPAALFDFILFIALEHSSAVTFPSQID